MKVGDFVEWSGKYDNPTVPPGTVGVVEWVTVFEDNNTALDVRYKIRNENKLMTGWIPDAWRLHKNSFVKQFIETQLL